MHHHKKQIISLIAVIIGIIPFFAFAETTWTSGVYENNTDVHEVLILEGVSEEAETELFIEGEVENNYDYVSVYRVVGGKKHLVETYTGSIRERIALEGNTVIVRLQSDYSVVKSGITATFKKKESKHIQAKSVETEEHIAAGSYVKVGNTESSCTADTEGSIRFKDGIFEGCDGKLWSTITRNIDYSTTQHTSCQSILNSNASAKDGIYRIQVGQETISVYCDMTTDGGGWTFIASFTNSSDQKNQGNWLPGGDFTPYNNNNNWENEQTFGLLDPTKNADYKSKAFLGVPGSEVMITFNHQYLLHAAGGSFNQQTFLSYIKNLSWQCAGSASLTTGCGNTSAVLNIQDATPHNNEQALLNGSKRTLLYFKLGEADGAQESNEDRVYISTNYRSNVDYPIGIGAYCNGSNCQNGAGQTDVNLHSDGVNMAPGDHFYGLYIR